jgi:hypothetical protein
MYGEAGWSTLCEQPEPPLEEIGSTVRSVRGLRLLFAELMFPFSLLIPGARPRRPGVEAPPRRLLQHRKKLCGRRREVAGRHAHCCDAHYRDISCADRDVRWHPPPRVTDTRC